MIPLLLVCSALGATPEATPESNLKAYEAAKAKVGHDAPSLVKLALWCEANGLDAQRQKHLAQAVLADPTNVTARALLGLVSFRGRWMTPEKAADAMRSDEGLAAKREKYEARREEIEREIGRRIEVARPRLEAAERQGGRAAAEAARKAIRREMAPDHVRLGLWCEANGLRDEALAHLHYAVVLDPYREMTWKHLGYVRRGDRWMTHAQAVAADKEDTARRKADRRWEPLLRRWRGWLDDPARRDEARRQLDAVEDPYAAPAIARILGDAATGDLAVAMLARFDTPESTHRLAEMAVANPSPWVRGAAIKALRGRDSRDYAGALVDLVHSAMKLHVQPVAGPGLPGLMVVETPRVKMIRTYDAPSIFRPEELAGGFTGFDDDGLPVAARGDQARRQEATLQLLVRNGMRNRAARNLEQANRSAADSQARMVSDIAAVDAANAQVIPRNIRVAAVLRETLGAPDLGNDEDAWKTWHYDRLGYRYEPPDQITVTVDATPQPPPPTISDCFAAGTPVRTPDGRKPIEALRVGDLVLSQDVTTGALGFQPILAVQHDAPEATLRLALDSGETIVTIPYHRFWLAGRGWATARTLKPGDALRTLGGRARIVAISDGVVLPVYNLDVARSRTFFVGRTDALVHDNTPPDPHQKPFDADLP